MANGRRQYKKMPYCMLPGKRFPQIEDDTNTVQSSANDNEGQNICWHRWKKTSATNYKDPSHKKVNNNRYDFKPAGKKYFETNT